ncbi:MAG: hypothetical protein SF182_07755 [Deltaproteobacteria bacterium]|nr:hypothetical protein [Deltaproteobacteria bacterium]
MTHRLATRLLGALLLVVLSPLAGRGATPGHFRPVEIWLDSGDVPLAAYQLEISAGGDAVIVGVEGGATPPFTDPPRYDPAALQGGRIILATFSTAADLPRGRTRVATLHVREAGDRAPQYHATVVAAAGADGRPIPATVNLVAQGDPS